MSECVGSSETAVSRPGELIENEVPVLELRGVTVVVDDRRLLHDVDLTVAGGECHALFGPNASGKTALLKAVMGLARYVVKSGQILLDGEDITHCSIDERARRGIGLFFQQPPVVHGLSLSELLQLSRPTSATKEEIYALAENFGCVDLLDRDVDDGFSGGETKLAELLQLVVRSPDLLLVDEPDAGVDVDNTELIGRNLAQILEGPTRGLNRRAAVVISHSGRIFDYIQPTVAHILTDGSLIRHDDPHVLLREIRAHGYRNLVR